MATRGGSVCRKPCASHRSDGEIDSALHVARRGKVRAGRRAPLKAVINLALHEFFARRDYLPQEP
jgi:hypothetical protein